MKFVKNIILSVIVTFLVIIGSFWFINIFTNHGESLSVPDFTGLTMQEVETITKDKGLRYTIIDTVYNGPVRPGTIVEQIPPKDFQVKEHRRIFLTIKSDKPEMIIMPDLVEKSWVQAKAELASRGLMVGNITFKKSDIHYFRVMEQNYNGQKVVAGTKIQKGEKIDIVLSESKDNQSTQIPDFFGLTYSDANSLAGSLMLNLSNVEYDETVTSHEDSINAKVRKQYPGKHVPLKPGDNVDIYLSMLQDTID